jgi:hypothetical protein
MAHMGQEGVATDLAVKDPPSGDDEGRVKGAIKEGPPNFREGAAEVRGREGATEGSTLGRAQAGWRGGECEPSRRSVEGNRVGVQVAV